MIALARTMFHAAWDGRSEQIKDAEASVKQQITAAEKQIDSLLARIINATNGSVIGAYEKKAATLEYIMPPHTLAAAAAEITGHQFSPTAATEHLRTVCGVFSRLKKCTLIF